MTYKFTNVKTFKELVKVCNDGSNSGDMGYLSRYITKWPTMITKFNKLYEGFPFTRNYSYAAVENSTNEQLVASLKTWKERGTSKEEIEKQALRMFSCEGMQTLCGGSTRDTELRDRLNKLVG